MEPIKEILVMHTAQDTANLICEFIKYSYHHDVICGGIKNALDNIYKTTKQCRECANCGGCRYDCEYCNDIEYCTEGCDGCDGCARNSTCNFYNIRIVIPVIFVICDWELLFRDICNINMLRASGVSFCGCSVIPDKIMFARRPHWINTNMCAECMYYVCPLCKQTKHVCSLNIIYNDGPVHLTLNYTEHGNPITLSII